eukprot:956963-Rhodomonas_salina.1
MFGVRYHHHHHPSASASAHLADVLVESEAPTRVAGEAHVEVDVAVAERDVVRVVALVEAVAHRQAADVGVGGDLVQARCQALGALEDQTLPSHRLSAPRRPADPTTQKVRAEHAG